MSDLYRNEFLAQLPSGLSAKIQVMSRAMVLSTGQALPLSGRTSNYTYFPETALLSLSQLVSGSASTEVMMVGVEGMLTAPGHRDATTSLSAQVLRGGSALRIEQTGLRELAREHWQLQTLLTAYSDYIIQQLCQVIACYRHHSVKQQLSRWILAHDDRFPRLPMRTTHAILAERLGVRREAVSTAASYLQSVGALHYHRGQIDWIDRSTLLLHSCSCYKALHEIEQKKAQPEERPGSG